MTGSAMKVPPFRPVRRRMSLRNCKSASACRTVKRLTPNSLRVHVLEGVGRRFESGRVRSTTPPRSRFECGASLWSAKSLVAIWSSASRLILSKHSNGQYSLATPTVFWYRQFSQRRAGGDTMIDRARVVVIAGESAAVRSSTGSQRLGWSDVALVERSELTSGLHVPFGGTRRPTSHSLSLTR